jgi:hypothetical protein
LVIKDELPPDTVEECYQRAAEARRIADRTQSSSRWYSAGFAWSAATEPESHAHSGIER